MTHACRNVSPSLSANCSSASEEGREEFYPALRLDMLVSFTASMADMSVRQSLYIEGPSYLVLPSDEEIAKREYGGISM